MGKKQLSILILIAHVLVLILYHQYAYIGHYGYDDMHYARLAHNFLSGQVDFQDHFTFRFPILIFTALSYFIFGISDFASSLPSLLFSVLNLILLYDVLKRINLRVLILGLSLCLFSNWYIFYSDKLMPDIYVVFGFMLSLYILYRFKFISDRSKPYNYSLLLAFSLLFTFISKATVVFIIPLLIYIFLVDLFQKRQLKFWLYFLLNGCIVLILYFVLIAWLTDDPFMRINAVNRNSYLSLCSYGEQPVNFLLERISYGFFNYMLQHGMLTAYIFIFAYLFQRKLVTFFKLNDSFSFFFSSSLILLLSCNFMTVSLTSYSPMCLDPRHYLFIVPIAAIAAACIIDEFLKNKSRGFSILLSLVIFALWSYFLETKTFWILYLPLFFIFFTCYFIRNQAYLRKIFIVLFLMVLLLTPYQMFQYASLIQYRKQIEVLKQLLLENEPSYIISDAMLSRVGEYYSGFETQKHEFLTFGYFNADTLQDRKKLLFINEYTQVKSGLQKQDLPYYARYIDSSNNLLFSDPELGIQVYELESLVLPQQDGTMLLNSLMDFEKKLPFWEQNSMKFSEKIAFDSSFSNEVKEYSTTFSFPLDSLNLQGNDALYIAVDLQAYLMEESKAMIVISTEDENTQAVTWEALPIQKYVRAYSHWWPISFDSKVELSALKKHSRLKVYVWNPDQNQLFIDNFQVKIIGL